MDPIWIWNSVASVLNLLFRDKEVLAAERAVEKQKMEENLVENKMNVILDSGLFSKVLTMMMTIIINRSELCPDI